jgi:hypothetical protein
VGSFTSLGAGRGGYLGRPSFAWSTFRNEIGLNPELVDDEVMRRFAKRAVDLRYNHTAEMIGLVDLRLPEGSRLDSRNSAMSAAAELLGVPRLLARSTDMRFVDDKGRVQEGTVMDFGRGLDLMREKPLFEQVADQPFAGEGAKGLRQLADLQILDYLCGNVDRHAGNLLYETNEKGEIIGIQGIDNDASFGCFAELKEANNRLPAVGDMNCVSKSMADTILKLDHTQLRFMLRGRSLSERELDYAVKRLNDMKIAIREGQKHYKGRPPISADTEKPFDKGFLREVSDTGPCAPIDRIAGDVFAVQIDVSGIGHNQTRGHVKRGGLACTIRAKKSYNLTLTHIDRHIVDHRALAVSFHQAFCPKHHAALRSDIFNFHRVILLIRLQR